MCVRLCTLTADHTQDICANRGLKLVGLNSLKRSMVRRIVEGVDAAE